MRLHLHPSSLKGSDRAAVPGACAHRRYARACGFTLVELLVVVALIAILISVLIPSLKRSLGLAADTVCMHNLRQIGQALELYRMDNEGSLPILTSDWPDAQPYGSVASPESPWFVRLAPTYIQDPMLLACPEDPYRRFVSGMEAQESNRPNRPPNSSYGISGFLLTAGDGMLARWEQHRPRRPLDTILVADIGPDQVPESSAGGSRGMSPGRHGNILAWDDGYDPQDPNASSPWITARHGNGSINILTLGGVVRAADTTALIQEPVQSYYENCAAGGCTLCNELGLPHYSFARDRLYWWTGPVPAE